MPGIINYKICDLARECGGFDVCRVGAFFWDEKKQRPDIDNNKCTSCGVCVRECPVGAILVIRNDKELAEIKKKLAADPRSAKDLWQERLGCQPGKTPPLAIVADFQNLSSWLKKPKVALDVWSNETLDCRYHSVLWSEVGEEGVLLVKLEKEKHPDLVAKFKVKKFPSLLLFRGGLEKARIEGYIYSGDKKRVKKALTF